MLIEHGDEHEIRNTGRTLLRTLNIYVPPACKPGKRGQSNLPEMHSAAQSFP